MGLLFLPIEGYGRRLLSLLGAGKFPMVLGNDFAGTVATTGAKVSELKPGDRVYGLKPTSADGTHTSHVVVKAAYVLRAPAGGDLLTLAALPYSFVTMWLAVRGAGITRENAAGKKVLVHGAAGGLGTLALQMLSGWGAKITAIARPPMLAGCLQAGAAEVVDGSKAPFSSLGRVFDATLNFATWDDDVALIGCLRPRCAALIARQADGPLRLVSLDHLRPSNCFPHFVTRGRGFIFGLIVECDQGPPVTANHLEAVQHPTTSRPSGADPQFTLDSNYNQEIELFITTNFCKVSFALSKV